MKKNSRLFVVYPLMIMLIVGGVFSANTDHSFAAKSFEISHGTKWVQGKNIDSGLRIKTSSGTVAYCLNQGRESPTGSYSQKLKLTSALKAVLYYGYPNHKKFGSVKLTSDQARCATQLAIWAHDKSGKGNKIKLSDLHGAYNLKPESDRVLKAAKWLYKKAKSGFKSPTIPQLPEPQVKKPSDNTPQFFDSTYVRVGPYRYTTTNNNYTMNNKVFIDLSNAPQGTKLGNDKGEFTTTPAEGKDFYIYLPSVSLTEPGKKSFKINVSYDYKYEMAPTFRAYEKKETQNVAISTKKVFKSGNKKIEAIADFGWTTGKLKKVDSEDGNKPVADTKFEIFYDPTPSNTSNNDWVPMYEVKTDEDGIIKIPGLGKGRYKLIETEPNPGYSLNGDNGGTDETIFQITDVSTEYIQVMTNDAIGISCDVDKDTIKKTSAAYRSLPDQEGFDNTKNEVFRYYVDYRSTANVWADEFVVDDPLEGVKENQIRVRELWTPISFGDSDGKMNIWYKTNKTDDEKVYSGVRAVASNPVNPNNPENLSVKKNTGYKLWAEDISTLSRTNLKVSDLNLEKDEYITALRLEHGKVEKGFTTRNHSYDSQNDESTVDWTPRESDRFYTKESAEAKGLKPLTYLVTCPEPLSPPDVIKNSAHAFIARNIDLTDDDKDEVFTNVIDSFKERPTDESIKFSDEPSDKAKVLGEFEKEKVRGAKTGDHMKIGLTVFLLLVTIMILLTAVFKKRIGRKTLSILLGLTLLGSIHFGVNTTQVHAESNSIQDSFQIEGLAYSLVKAEKSENSPNNSDAYKVKYLVKQKVRSEKIDSIGQKKLLPPQLDVSVKKYKGIITLDNKSLKPLYLKKQVQIDKRETLKDLNIEDITNLPDSKTYTVRSDRSVNATVQKELKRAGVSLKITGRDNDGIPNKWDATMVYRGLESFLEKYSYDVKAIYTGNISKSLQVSEVVHTERPEDKNFEDLTLKEAKKRSEDLAKEKYIKYKDNEESAEVTKTISEKKLDDKGWKTGDFIKYLGFIAILSAVSFVLFIVLTGNRKRQIPK